MMYLKTLENLGRKTRLYNSVLFTLLSLGLLISFYLLYRHMVVVQHLSGKTDICSIVFGSGCDGALTSALGTEIGLPLAGWGIIYYVVMILLLLLPPFLGNSYKADTSLPVFTLALIASLTSITLLGIMFFNHSLFCPFCLIIHCINLVSFFCLIKKTAFTFPIFFSKVRHEVALLFTVGTSKNAVIIKWLGLATFSLLTISLYVGLQMVSAKTPSINPKEIITEYMHMPVQQMPIETDDPVFGSTASPVKIVVFSDFQCPSCRYFYQVMQELNKQYSGRFYIVFKYFPLSSECNLSVTKNIHPEACKAAFAAAAANEQGKFWELHDLLFSIEWKHNQETFSDMARNLNLDTMRFEKAFSGETTREKVLRSIRQGVELNITGTPTIYVNDKKINDFRLKPMEIIMNFLLEEPVLKNIN